MPSHGPNTDMSYAPSTSVKGKERAMLKNEFPGPDAVTYRHLLRNTNPTNPLRIVAHCDIDAAYAAMEIARLGLDPTAPVAVRQWEGLIAVNYPAREYGITRMETAAEALKKCPELVMVHCASYKAGEMEAKYHAQPNIRTHKISLDYYRRESMKIIQILRQFSNVVEKASVDEAFLDLTERVKEEILAEFPQLKDASNLEAQLPTPQELGVRQLDWEGLGNLIQEPRDNNGEGNYENQEREVLWQDIAVHKGSRIMNECRQLLSSTLGYTCSAGISRNKMLAKLCSAFKKPNDQTVLCIRDIPYFLKTIKIKKIRGLGGKLGQAFREEFSAETISEVLGVTVDQIKAHFGEQTGQFLWEAVRGIDLSLVNTRTEMKSMSGSKNFRPPLKRRKTIFDWLTVFSTELYVRLLEERQTNAGFWPKTISMHLRIGYGDSRSRQIPFSYTENLTVSFIFGFAKKLVEEAQKELFESKTKGSLVDGEYLDLHKDEWGPFYNLSLSFSHYDRMEGGQQAIFSFLKEKGDDDDTIIIEDDDDNLMEKCSRCGHLLQVSDDVSENREEAFRRIVEEHRDYHFARDMVEKERKQERSQFSKAVTQQQPKKRKTDIPKPEAVKDSKRGTKKAKSTPVSQKGNPNQATLAGFFKK